MNYSSRFRLLPTAEQREAMDWQRNTVRQLYNHALNEFNQIPENAGTLRQRVWMVRDTLPELKDWWPDLNQVYSTVLQKAVERIRDNIQNLGKLKAKGYDVGSLNWKKPRDFRSFTYRQSGFELDKKSGPNGRTRRSSVNSSRPFLRRSRGIKFACVHPSVSGGHGQNGEAWYFVPEVLHYVSSPCSRYQKSRRLIS